MKPAVSLDAYRAVRHGAAIIERADRGRIMVSGADRASYLHGLLTNDVLALRQGSGCYAAYLTPQGRMIADMWLYELGDSILMTLSRDVKDLVLSKLDQFVFTEDVQLGDVTEAYCSMALVGPLAPAVLARALAASDAALPLAEHGNVRLPFDGEPAIITRVTDTGEPGYDVCLPPCAMDRLRARLRTSGVGEVDDATAEAVRIEAGVPRFHRDMNEETIPLEAGIEPRAISLTKGCYVGQEVIIRVLHRGHGRVARKLAGLVFTPDQVPGTGAQVQAQGRPIGSITSGAWSPSLERGIALGYLHRDFLSPGTAVEVEGVPGEVVALPFVRLQDNQVTSRQVTR
jgi:folate-binding protein YgfZ